jgi:hypothetical protein
MKLRFQLAALQIAFLCQLDVETDVRSSLERVPDSLTKAYDEIYKRILNQKGSGRQLALNAFRWVKYSYEPLASETLLDAVIAEVSESGEFSRKLEGQISAATILKCCQNFLILDESLGVFRFAHLSVEEYLETKLELTDVESHTYIADVCISLLCDRNYWDRYDKILETWQGHYKDRHLLLYSAIFWPWHFSRCEEVCSGNSKVVWDKFVSQHNYRRWLNYQRSTIIIAPWHRDLFWEKLYAFREQNSDTPFNCGLYFWAQSIIHSFI